VPAEPLVGPLGVVGVDTVSAMVEKLAVTLLRAFIVIVRGFVIPDASPDHPEKL